MKIMKHLREPVNGLTHFFAAIAGLIGTGVLVYLAHDHWQKLVSLLVYGLSVVLLFAASATYHLVKGSPTTIEKLRKFDHSAIFILIAGSYTPFCYNNFTGFWKWGLLAIIWSIAIIGVLIKSFYVRSPRWVSATIYVAMGWIVILAIGEMIRTLPAGAIVWIAVGGVIYTLGAVVYATKMFNFIPNKFGYHEVWHIFVILGAAAHFIAIAGYIAPKG
ncbi:MAG TPA: hemolysin III family protein [Anaerolineales bacterium]|nr:hemolysin III family protein [Anaerolineales bacterium]